jgi:chorismate-pyruvate lyase
MLGFLGLISAGPVTARPDLVPVEGAAPVEGSGHGDPHALITAFNARLLESRTATSALETWCREHLFAKDAAIRARVIRTIEKPASAEQRERLRLRDADIVKYRRVELACGPHVLSEADNWYVPGRLTERMNHRLATTDMPFGRVVEDLRPVRKTFLVEFLWQKEAGASAPGEAKNTGAPGPDVPRLILRHRALVLAADATPFAEVHETYTRAILPTGGQRPEGGAPGP